MSHFTPLALRGRRSFAGSLDPSRGPAPGSGAHLGCAPHPRSSLPRPVTLPRQYLGPQRVDLDLGPADWLALAACLGKGDLFYRDDRLSQSLALEVCRGCPVQQQCEAETRLAEASGGHHGVRCGMTARQRRSWDR
jgi:hypothetical protein